VAKGEDGSEPNLRKHFKKEREKGWLKQYHRAIEEQGLRKNHRGRSKRKNTEMLKGKPRPMGLLKLISLAEVDACGGTKDKLNLKGGSENQKKRRRFRGRRKRT